MSKTIKPLADTEIESPADSVMRRKINELVEQTNENTLLIEAMPAYEKARVDVSMKKAGW